ncbi:hypothetical protein [Tateyamaria sp.]|uniref:hypothetical protein n=1 Tax=Tateyamaria sp. TaxID=1929288 RepID=UPI003B217B6A
MIRCVTHGTTIIQGDYVRQWFDQDQRVQVATVNVFGKPVTGPLIEQRRKA